MSLALASQTAPRDWRGESDEVIATALTILRDQAEEATAG